MTPTMIDRAAATQWLSRYQAGEHEAVWAEMVSLGADVRSKPYLEPAWAVAQETMRRARHDSDARQQIEIVLGWDADTKANLVMADEQIDQGYSVMCPAPVADVVLRNEPNQRSFVDHLRVAFRFGGFPGWERHATRPEKELRLLSDGLLPI